MENEIKDTVVETAPEAAPARENTRSERPARPVQKNNRRR